MRPVVRLFVVAVATVWSMAAAAQSTCSERLAEAQDLYVNGAFEDVEERLAPCLQAAEMDEDERVQAFRLLALATLRRGELVEAKLVALRLLTLRPDYEPDPVLDPPSYADLISTVRSQLAVEPPEERTPADTSRVEPEAGELGPVSLDVSTPRPVLPVRQDVPEAESPARRGRRSPPVEISLWGGNLSFAGGIDRNDVLNDHFRSDGLRLGLQISYAPASWIALGLAADGAEIAQFPVQRGTSQRPSRRVEARVGLATLDVRLRAWPNAVLSPYMSLGGSVVVGQMEDETRIGGGPSASLGFDLAPARRVSLFGEAMGTIPWPRDAFDDSEEQFGDLFSGFRGGLRTRIGR